MYKKTIIIVLSLITEYKGLFNIIFPNFKGIIYMNTSDFDGIAEDPLSHHILYMMTTQCGKNISAWTESSYGTDI